MLQTYSLHFPFHILASDQEKTIKMELEGTFQSDITPHNTLPVLLLTMLIGIMGMFLLVFMKPATLSEVSSVLPPSLTMISVCLG